MSIYLDFLAFQHKDQWEKKGYAIIDVIGQVSLPSDEKIVTARLVPGCTYDGQVYSATEGIDPAFIPPFSQREKIEGIDCFDAVEDISDEPVPAPPSPFVELKSKEDDSEKELSNYEYGSADDPII